MRYVNRFDFLLVALFCLGMSSSVLAESYTFEGHMDRQDGDNVPYSFNNLGNIFVGQVEYEHNGLGSDGNGITLTSFSVTLDGEIVGFSNFANPVQDPESNYSYIDEGDQWRFSAQIEGDGMFEGTPLASMTLFLHWDSYNGNYEMLFAMSFGEVGAYDRPGQFVAGNITGGTFFNEYIYTDGRALESYTFSGVIGTGDDYLLGNVPFSEGDEVKGEVVYEYVTGGIRVYSFSVTIDGKMIALENFKGHDSEYLNYWPDTSASTSSEVELVVRATAAERGYGVFGEYGLGEMLLVHHKLLGISYVNISFGSLDDFIRAPITGGTISEYPRYFPPAPISHFTCYGFEPPLGNGLITGRELPSIKAKKKDPEAPSVISVKFKLRDEATGIWITGDTLEGIGFPRMNPQFLDGEDVNVPSLDPIEFMLPSSETTEPRTGVFWWNSEEGVWQYNWGILTEEENPNWRSGILEIFPYSTEPTAYTIDDSCRARVLLK